MKQNKMTFKIKIDKRITEQQLVESCLNLKYSGASMDSINLMMAIYFMGTKSPNALYYLKLLNEED